MTRLKHLPDRDLILRGIRAFFQQRGYLEVETPCLIDIPSMEPHIDPFFVVDGSSHRYLRTSPEYAIKKLLSQGVENVFTIGPCFRDEPHSAHHHSEFTMLEWYATGATLFELMDETESLIRNLWSELGQPALFRGHHRLEIAQPFARISISDLWQQTVGFCPIEANTFGTLVELAKARKLRFTPEIDCYDTLFHQIFLNHIEPVLEQNGLTFVWGWPASQAALARLNSTDPRIALRFELYGGGLELANAFDELTDTEIQRERLLTEQQYRAAHGLPVFPIDEALLANLSKIPPTAGIALGVDRLVMLLLNARHISEVRL